MGERISGRLSGRVAIVTGAGMGIGRGVVRRFAREGATVVVADLRAEAGERTARELVDDLGAQVHAVATDMSHKDDIEHLVADTIARHGQIDVVVNNAQAFTPLVPLEDKSDEMMAASLDSGLWGTYWMLQALFPHMRGRHYGRIVNFCSLNMVTGAWYSADYNATKSAIEALTRTAAREWGPYGITVNAIAPAAASEGYLAYKERSPREAEAAERGIPVGRMGDPENDIGGVALFLVSDDGAYITGHTLFADGGGHLGTAWRPPRSTRPDGLGHWVPEDA